MEPRITASVTRYALVRSDNPYLGEMTDQEFTEFVCTAMHHEYIRLGWPTRPEDKIPYWVVDERLDRLMDPDKCHLDDEGTHYVMYGDTDEKH